MRIALCSAPIRVWCLIPVVTLCGMACSDDGLEARSASEGADVGASEDVSEQALQTGPHAPSECPQACLAHWLAPADREQKFGHREILPRLRWAGPYSDVDGFEAYQNCGNKVAQGGQRLLEGGRPTEAHKACADRASEACRAACQLGEVAGWYDSGGSCTGANETACRSYAERLNEGARTPKDRSRAREILHRMCKAGSGKDCVLLAHGYRTGEHGAVDFRKAGALLAAVCRDKSCDAPKCRGGAICLEAGRLYDRGAEGLGANPSLARPIYERGCSQGNPKACALVGKAALALEKYIAICDERAEPEYCSAAAESLLHSLPGIPADRPKGLSLHKVACKRGRSASACVLAAEILRAGEVGIPRDERGAIQAYEAGCSGGRAIACYQAGIAYSRGELGLRRNPLRGRRLVWRAHTLLTRQCLAGGRVDPVWLEGGGLWLGEKSACALLGTMRQALTEGTDASAEFSKSLQSTVGSARSTMWAPVLPEKARRPTAWVSWTPSGARKRPPATVPPIPRLGDINLEPVRGGMEEGGDGLDGFEMLLPVGTKRVESGPRQLAYRWAEGPREFRVGIWEVATRPDALRDILTKWAQEPPSAQKLARTIAVSTPLTVTHYSGVSVHPDTGDGLFEVEADAVCTGCRGTAHLARGRQWYLMAICVSRGLDSVVHERLCRSLKVTAPDVVQLGPCVAAGRCRFRTDQDCVHSLLCADEGRCAAKPDGTGCVAASHPGCRQSWGCADAGRCVAAGGRCVSDLASCPTSSVCREDGRCVPNGGRCCQIRDDNSFRCSPEPKELSSDIPDGVAAADPVDCDKASLCAARGRCAEVDGVCRAWTDEDCRYSAGCTWAGACARAVEGVCVPLRLEHCAKSEVCRLFGHCVIRPDGLCGASESSVSCERSIMCKREGLCVARAGWCQLPCTKLSACEDHGLCAQAGDACIASSNDDCALSTACAEQAECTASDGVCIVSSADDCKSSLLCSRDELCGFADGVCVYDCATSDQCLQHGRCTLEADKVCIATRAEDCEASKGCEDSGLCVLESDVCVIDCRKVAGCRDEGLCTRVAGVCSATTDLDCQASRACANEGRCIVGSGGCVAPMVPSTTDDPSSSPEPESSGQD